MMLNLKISSRFLFFLACLTLLLPACTMAISFQGLEDMLGPRDALVVSGPGNHVLFSHNADTLLIPASTLKILTALTAFHYLGKNYRFRTEFYMDPDSNLKIKGYGDPLLISEVIADLTASLHDILKDKPHLLSNIIVDPSYFDTDVVIPGVTDTPEPYDSPNGALCVNFNTVNFKTVNNKFISAEPQTPLLSMTLRHIKKTGLSLGRITLSHQKDEIAFYAGYLFKYFLEQTGVNVAGKVLLGQVDPDDHLIFRHYSPFTLVQVVEKMMAYSNNFMANQMFLETGITHAGPPGTLAKGVLAARIYAQKELALPELQISEGSGISRKNRITAKNLHQALLEFKPHYRLLRQNGTDFFKTGTLKDISTRVGFMGQDDATRYAYVIICNTSGKSATHIKNRLMDILIP